MNINLKVLLVASFVVMGARAEECDPLVIVHSDGSRLAVKSNGEEYPIKPGKINEDVNGTRFVTKVVSSDPSKQNLLVVVQHQHKSGRCFTITDKKAPTKPGEKVEKIRTKKQNCSCKIDGFIVNTDTWGNQKGAAALFAVIEALRSGAKNHAPQLQKLAQEYPDHIKLVDAEERTGVLFEEKSK